MFDCCVVNLNQGLVGFDFSIFEWGIETCLVLDLDFYGF